MKTNLFLTMLLLLLFGSGYLSAQSLSRSVIGSAGDFYEDDVVGDLHFTLGEIAIEYFDEEDVLAQGFHRLHRPLFTVDVEKPSETTFDFTIYPNPTADYVIVQSSSQNKLRLTVTDILGRSVRQTILSPNRQTLNISELPVGTYAFSVYDNSNLLYLEKVQIIR